MRNVPDCEGLKKRVRIFTYPPAVPPPPPIWTAPAPATSSGVVPAAADGAGTTTPAVPAVADGAAFSSFAAPAAADGAAASTPPAPLTLAAPLAVYDLKADLQIGVNKKNLVVFGVHAKPCRRCLDHLVKNGSAEQCLATANGGKDCVALTARDRGVFSRLFGMRWDKKTDDDLLTEGKKVLGRTPTKKKAAPCSDAAVYSARALAYMAGLAYKTALLEGVEDVGEALALPAELESSDLGEEFSSDEE
ncbi:hypothetical protein NQ176_g499 [Zarea fungicola]|uniref:Uncharacterized protein n=1 Tax=Zarea fungicola TaxID=93591 RepID=A0ACC1NXA6_9HYPO|nr:hypothetical protein NQ176_g499 [Lecanicillium fungicola]